MTVLLEKLQRDALSLPAEERAFLADRLLSSLDGEVLSDVDAAWVAEAERRYQEYKKGATIKSGGFGGQFGLKIAYCPSQPALAVQFVGWEGLSQGSGQQLAARDSGCLRDLLPSRSQPCPRSKAE